jgi:hypothetical protein
MRWRSSSDCQPSSNEKLADISNCVEYGVGIWGLGWGCARGGAWGVLENSTSITSPTEQRFQDSNPIGRYAINHAHDATYYVVCMVL